jgi:hypothetical protein
LKAGQKPALSSPFSSGMTFSRTGLEQSGSYQLWSGTGITVPIAAVPGLNFMVSPSVSVAVAGGVDWSRNAVTARVGVDGTVQVGLSYGAPNLAEIYAAVEATASGGFSYERTNSSTPAAQGAGGAQAQAAATQAGTTWKLEGAITLGAGMAVGVKLGGGIIEKRFQLGQIEVGRLGGITFDNRGMNRNLTWTWSAEMRAMFAEIRSAIDQARRIMAMGAEAAEAAWQGLADAGGWAYNGLAAAGRAIRDGTYAAGRGIRDGTYAAGRGIRDGAVNAWNWMTGD